MTVGSHDAAVTAVAALPPACAAQVASGCLNGEVKLWSLDHSAHSHFSGSPVRVLREHAQQQRSVRALLWLPVGYEEVGSWERLPTPAAAAAAAAATDIDDDVSEKCTHRFRRGGVRYRTVKPERPPLFIAPAKDKRRSCHRRDNDEDGSSSSEDDDGDDDQDKAWTHFCRRRRRRTAPLGEGLLASAGWDGRVHLHDLRAPRSVATIALGAGPAAGVSAMAWVAPPVRPVRGGESRRRRERWAREWAQAREKQEESESDSCDSSCFYSDSDAAPSRDDCSDDDDDAQARAALHRARVAAMRDWHVAAAPPSHASYRGFCAHLRSSGVKTTGPNNAFDAAEKLPSGCNNAPLGGDTRAFSHTAVTADLVPVGIGMGCSFPGLLATAGWDRLIRTYDLRSLHSPLHVLLGHRQAVVSLAAAPGGGELISAARDGTVRWWDLAAGGGAAGGTYTASKGGAPVSEAWVAHPRARAAAVAVARGVVGLERARQGSISTELLPPAPVPVPMPVPAPVPVCSLQEDDYEELLQLQRQRQQEQGDIPAQKGEACSSAAPRVVTLLRVPTEAGAGKDAPLTRVSVSSLARGTVCVPTCLPPWMSLADDASGSNGNMGELYTLASQATDVNIDAAEALVAAVARFKDEFRAKRAEKRAQERARARLEREKKTKQDQPQEEQTSSSPGLGRLDGLGNDDWCLSLPMCPGSFPPLLPPHPPTSPYTLSQALARLALSPTWAATATVPALRALARAWERFVPLTRATKGAARAQRDEVREVGPPGLTVTCPLALATACAGESEPPQMAWMKDPFTAAATAPLSPDASIDSFLLASFPTVARPPWLTPEWAAAAAGACVRVVELPELPSAAVASPAGVVVVASKATFQRVGTHQRAGSLTLLDCVLDDNDPAAQALLAPLDACGDGASGAGLEALLAGLKIEGSSVSTHATNN